MSTRPDSMRINAFVDKPPVVPAIGRANTDATQTTDLVDPPYPADDTILNPSARLLWRSHDCVQVELGTRAVVIDGVDSALISALTTATAPAPSDAGRTHGARDVADALRPALAQLRADGFAWPRPRTNTPPAQPDLAGELAALRVRHGLRAEGILAQRATASVIVHGTGRLAVAIACVLGAASVGRVTMHDSGEVHRHDAAPGGLLASDEGRRFNEAAHDAIRRAAPIVDTRAAGPDERADLVILTGTAPVSGELRAWLHERGVAHLASRTGADDAVVGPLVLPGLTSCLACADESRLDRDPAWSVLAVQLSTPTRHAAPSDLALTQLTASLTAMQALAYLDGDDPATLAGTLELRLPDWRIRRRSWAPHPRCDCGANGDEPPGRQNE
jgi:hypothetical protein